MVQWHALAWQGRDAHQRKLLGDYGGRHRRERERCVENCEEPGELNVADADVIHLIGNTWIVELRRIVPRRSARILLKLEFENPTGSMKVTVAPDTG